MKMLVHRTYGGIEVPFSSDELLLHVRAQGDEELGAVMDMGRTAAAELEHFAQIALLNQTILVTVFEPPCDAGFSLPIGPVLNDTDLVISVDGATFDDFSFVEGHRPYVHWGPSFASLNPKQLAIEYTAGFGETHASVPHDLVQALMDQAALHFDGRSPMDAKSLTTSPHMARIGARYRGVQL